MVPRAFTIGGGVALAVASALVAASLSPGSFLGAPPEAEPGPVTPLPPSPRPRDVPTGTGGIPTWLVTSMTVLLALYAVALLVLALTSLRGRKERKEPLELSDNEPGVNAAWDTLLAVDLDNAAQAQLGALQRGTPRNAIVACWLALQTATRGAGLPDVRTDTSEEFMLRAVRSLGLDPPAILELSALYREARFSEHVMLEMHRQQAGQALQVLADQLAGRRGPSAADKEQTVSP